VSLPLDLSPSAMGRLVALNTVHAVLLAFAAVSGGAASLAAIAADLSAPGIFLANLYGSLFPAAAALLFAWHQSRWAKGLIGGPATRERGLLIGGILMTGSSVLTFAAALRFARIAPVNSDLSFILAQLAALLTFTLGCYTVTALLRPLAAPARGFALAGAMAGGTAVTALLGVLWYGSVLFTAAAAGIASSPPLFGAMAADLLFAPYGPNGVGGDEARLLVAAVIAATSLTALAVLRWTRGLRAGALPGRGTALLGLGLIAASLAPHAAEHVSGDRVVYDIGALAAGAEFAGTAAGLAILAAAAWPLTRPFAVLGAAFVLIRSQEIFSFGSGEAPLALLTRLFAPESIFNTLYSLAFYLLWIALFAALWRSAGRPADA